MSEDRIRIQPASAGPSRQNNWNPRPATPSDVIPRECTALFSLSERHAMVDELVLNYFFLEQPGRSGKNLQLEELVRVNYLPCAGRVYYLTIKATDSNFYEAEVYMPIRGDPPEVHFVRPAVHSPNISREIRQYDAPDT